MEKYIIFLRGINISGKNKIEMKKLKEETIKLGYFNVSTYLNSGNLILSSNIDNKNEIKNSIDKMIKNKFNLDIPIFIIKQEELKDLLDNKPGFCKENDKEIYNNIIFIIKPCTYEEVYKELGTPDKKLEKIKEYNNNIYWSYNLKDYRKSIWWKNTASKDIRNKITIRTYNTVKKVLELCEESI